jgi:Protein of unknown function (DUF3037)
MTEELRLIELRYVPRLLSSDCIVFGLLLTQENQGRTVLALTCFIEDWSKIAVFDDEADIEILQAFAREAAAETSDPKRRDDFLRRMGDSLSNQIQLSAPKEILSDDPATEIENLARTYFGKRDDDLAKTTMGARSK